MLMCIHISILWSHLTNIIEYDFEKSSHSGNLMAKMSHQIIIKNLNGKKTWNV